LSDKRLFSTSTQVAFNSVVLLVVILSVSALFIYRVSESVFIRNYSEEMRKIFMDSPMGRGMRMGIGRIIGRGGTEFYVRIEGIVVQNPNGLSNVPDVEGYMKTRIGGSSYLFYSFTNGNDKILLGAQMDDLDFFLQSLSTTLVLSTIIGVALSILSGYLLGRRVSKPLREATSLLKEITLEDLSRRVEIDPKTSELAELKKALNTALDRIEDGYKRQEQFSSDIAHEIRSPLTSILGFSRMIQRWGSKDPDALKEAAESITATAGKMLTITEGLLFLARPVIETNRESFNLGELVNELVQSTPVPGNITVEVDVENVQVTTDRALLKIALKVLLENAMKYGKGRPIVFYWADGSLHVRDHGDGINEGEIDRIFDRFYRSDSSRSGGGHGLGLSIVRKICDTLDLTITAENNEDGGAVFSIGRLL